LGTKYFIQRITSFRHPLLFLTVLLAVQLDSIPNLKIPTNRGLHTFYLLKQCFNVLNSRNNKVHLVVLCKFPIRKWTGSMR